MEKSAKSRDGEGLEKVAGGKDEPQKKKKLVYFEIDNCNNAQNVYEVSNFKIEELFRTPSKVCDGGSISSDDGLAHGPSTNHRDHISISKSCQLPVASGDVSTIMFDEFGIDLKELQNRILELEKQLKNDNLGLPPIFSDLKSQVENFRNKLETAERYKRTELQKQPFCQRFQYRRTSSERGRKVRERFLNICDQDISESTKDWLKQPSFDTSQYEDEEILLFLQHMFFELGLISKFDIPVTTLRNFLYEVYKNYNEVPFHNFRHCFCVAQMMYVMIWSVDIPRRMGDLDTLILLTSCICHDLDHPGYNNIYQINARTELALLYNDISPLENHHCSVAFRILENPDCNIFISLDKETFKEIREGIIRCILATDMARHNEILTQFKDVTPEFDFSNKSHKNLLSMILIKVADISNEARPMNVAEPWLDRLLMEFFKQSDAEKQEGLPVTPFMDRDKITKPSSQCSFIGFVLLPLFEALGELLPELHDLIIAPAKYALEHYKRLNEAAKDERMRRKSVVEAGISESNEDLDGSNMVKSGSGHSVRSRRSLCTSCSQVRQRSKSSEEFEMDPTPPSSPGALSGHNVEDLEDLEEREEIEEEELDEDDEETVTEVEVSEKTLKFKISTESSSTSIPGRKSVPGNFSGSRKGSRERNQYLENDLEWSRMMKDEDGRSLKRSITSDTMGSRKGSSDSEKLSFEKTSRKDSGGSEKVAEDGGSSRKSSRQKDPRTKGSYENKKKVEYRRQSLAVVERTRDWDPTRRRKSISNTHEIKKRETLKGDEGDGKKKEDGKREERERQKIDDSILDKLDSVVSENRCSREFETSCWGLQNLKRQTTVSDQPAIVVNNTLKCSLQKTSETEKSKSEDNLSIKNSKKLETSSALENNINVSKTDDSIEKQLTGTLEKKKKLGSNGHLSIFTKLKNLRDRMSFGSRESETGSDAGDLQRGSNSAEKTGKSNSDNQNFSKECEDDSEKSRTLPKTKKPNRTSDKMKKGWRALIGRSEGNSSSSLEVLPPSGSPSPVHPNLRKRRNSSVEEEKTKGGAVGGRSTEVGSSSLAERKKSGWLSSPKKSGFLSKMGRNEEDNCPRHTFLNNLTSSFRKKGNSKSEDETGASSSSSMQEGSKPN